MHSCFATTAELHQNEKPALASLHEMLFHRLLSHPTIYHYLRQILTGGMPFSEIIRLSGLEDPTARVADIGCGPADALRYLNTTRPQFYLGIDVSQTYLDFGKRLAAEKKIDALFVRLDLEELTHSESVQTKLHDLLVQHGITHVLLMGVLHHISDDAVKTTLRLLHNVASVRTITTQDVILLPGHRINNFFCSLDRGEFIRSESGYHDVLRQTPWPRLRKVWTQTGIRFIKYINHVLER